MSNIHKDQTQHNKDSVFRTEIKTDLNTNLNAGQDQLLRSKGSKSNTDLLRRMPQKRT